MRVVVTGGAGFIGSHLVHALVERGYEVIVIDNFRTGNSKGLPPEVKWYQFDVEDTRTTALITQYRPQVVFHLAAQVGMGSSMNDPAEDGKINILGTLRVLEGCRQSGSKLVFSSTSGVYGEPPNRRTLKESSPKRPLAAYGLSKWVAEQYIQKSGEWWGNSYTILRYANVYGPGQTAKGEGGVVACFLDQIAKGDPLIINGNGEQSRDFVHVDDVVRANLAAIDLGERQVCNISTGVATSVNQLAEWCERLTGNIRGERIYKPSRSGDVLCSRLSPRLAESALGWKPSVTLYQGLSRLIRGQSPTKQ
ncbi:UDP-glucose 4-epimerase [Cohnella abietis]|uniref:UDP-glucose 4-epimerase n=2 Tax=Cohnella abietis TaxID=2507935 RepID=A0A3T1DA81_9BACL|nr:UDP-glucose 4-epimerase [Cohnella abietis]